MKTKYSALTKEDYPKNLFLQVVEHWGLDISNKDLTFVDENGYNKKWVLHVIDQIKPKYKKILELRFIDHMTYENIGKFYNVSRERGRQLTYQAMNNWRLQYLKFFNRMKCNYVCSLLPIVRKYKLALSKYGIITIQDLINVINRYGYLLSASNDIWVGDLTMIFCDLDKMGIPYNDPIGPFLGHIKTCLYNLTIDNDPYYYLGYDRFCVPVYDEIVNDIITDSHNATDEYSNLSRIINYLPDDKVELVKRDLESFKQQLIYKGLLVEY